MNTKKLFLKGLNTDEVDHLMAPEEYLGAMNMRFTTAEGGKVGYLSNIEGNVIKNTSPTGAFTLPSGVNTTIGSYEDPANRRVYFFNKNSNGDHGIYCYDNDAELVYTVLLNSQVTGGLGFSTDIHSVAMVDDQLFWTDGVNEPRRINVLAGMKMNHPSLFSGVTAYTSPLEQSVITVIRNQPWACPTVQKKQDLTYSNNFISNEAFQFAYRFVYRDYELSTFSPLSSLVNYNYSSETYNYVTVTIPTAQKIEQDVIRVELAVRYAVGGKLFIIKTIKDSLVFSQHNSGSAISFDFYNDVAGISVDDATANKQYDVVPLKSNSLEIAKNRLFLADNTEGYVSPSSTSMTLNATYTGTSSLTGNWCKFVYKKYGLNQTLYVIDIAGISPNPGYYEMSPTITPPPYPSTVAWSSLTFRGAGVGAIVAYLGIAYTDLVSFTSGLGYPTITGYPGSIPSLTNKSVFKSDSVYRLGVVFYDKAGRKCGVVSNDSLKINIADRTYLSSSYATSIDWTLINSGDTSIMQTEIPSWAYYYQPVITKCLRASSFVQLRCDDIKYVEKKTDGTYDVTKTAYVDTWYGLAVKVSSLFGLKMGYTYQDGDILKLYPSTGAAPFKLKVKDTYGEYVICDLADLSSLSGTITNYLYEIYTPYLQSAYELYYETGTAYKVTNPGLSTRTYSTTNGSLTGDVSMIERTQGATAYLTENMSPSQTYWSYWNTNTGRTNIISDATQLVKRVNIRYSNVITLGSEVNGLCTFDALDETQLPFELNSIKRMLLVSKIESEGTVMLAIGEQETASIYLGETQVFDNTGSSFLAKSSGVIGNINVLRGSFGTINPESAIRVYGSVYWFDATYGAVVRYDTNGLFPVSSNKMFRYFKKIGRDVRAGDLKVFSGFDPYTMEILFYTPQTSLTPQNEILEDQIIREYSFSNEEFYVVDSDGNYIQDGSSNLLIYNPSGDGSYSVTIPVVAGRLYKALITSGTVTYAGSSISSNQYFYGVEGYNTMSVNVSIGGSYNIYEYMRSIYSPYDGQGGVFVYKPEIDRWTSFYSYRPEWFCLVGDRLVTFKGGYPYVHNSGVYNQFYGDTYDSMIAFLHNEAGNETKVYSSISIEGDTPSRAHVRTEVPYVQSTDAVADTFDYRSRLNGDFMVKEGVSYADIYRDRLSPNVTGTYDSKMMKGDPIRGEIAKFQVAFLLPNTLKKIKFVNVGFTPSWGNKTANG